MCNCNDLTGDLSRDVPKIRKELEGAPISKAQKRDIDKLLDEIEGSLPEERSEEATARGFGRIAGALLQLEPTRRGEPAANGYDLALCVNRCIEQWIKDSFACNGRYMCMAGALAKLLTCLTLCQLRNPNPNGAGGAIVPQPPGQPEYPWPPSRPPGWPPGVPYPPPIVHGTPPPAPPSPPRGWESGKSRANQTLFKCKKAFLVDIPAGVCVEIRLKENGGALGDTPGEVQLYLDGQEVGAMVGDGTSTLCGPGKLEVHLKDGEDDCKVEVVVI